MALLSVFLIFLNLQLWRSGLVGSLFFGIYLFLNSIWLKKILSKIIPFEPYGCYLLAVYCLLILIAFGGAVFVVFWKITSIIMIGILLVITLIISFLSHQESFSKEIEKEKNSNKKDRRGFVQNRGLVHNSEDQNRKEEELGKRGGMGILKFSLRNFKAVILNRLTALAITKKVGKQWLGLTQISQRGRSSCTNLLFFCLLALLLSCLFVLWKARTGSYILSPWQVIQPVYLYLWFFITFITAYLIFSNYENLKRTSSVFVFDNEESRTRQMVTPINIEKRIPTTFILLIIILHSFLLHAYLPIVYKIGFGGDRWRHIGTEKYLQQGEIYSPALFGQEIKWQKFGLIKIPSVFVLGSKTSYANQWALTIFLSWILQKDVFWIDIFLLPILWSIFVPLFLFILGRLILEDIRISSQKISNNSRVFPLLLAFIPSLFYPFQFYGSITIPMSFGFLLFLFLLLILIFALKQKDLFRGLANQSKQIMYKHTSQQESKDCLMSKPEIFVSDRFRQIFSKSKLLDVKCSDKKEADSRQLTSNVKGQMLVMCYLLCLLLLYFNYILYFVLFLEIGLMIFLFRKIRNKGKFSSKNYQTVHIMCYVLCVMCLLLLIPILDTTYSLTEWRIKILKEPILALSSLGEFIQKLLGFDNFLSLPTYITQGNFIYMQTIQSLSSNRLFSLTRWPVIISSIIWLFIAYGIFSFKKQSKRLNPSIPTRPLNLRGLLAIFLVITLGNQFISNHFMQGVHILSKRLDLTIAFLMIPFLALGIYKFINLSSRFAITKAKIILICLFLALASTSTYASGPKLEVVTEDEYRAAEYVWKQLKQTTGSRRQTTNYCVLANTWPLLALEAVSAREIIAGGFPVYREYAQPERVELFRGMSMQPSPFYMEKALEITDASSCYFMIEKRFWNEHDPRILEKLKEIFGDYKKIGEAYVFYYRK